MNSFDYIAPGTMRDSLRALAARRAGEARALAGGTDLLPLMKAHVSAPKLLVGLKQVNDLPRRINFDEYGLTLGALTTLADIESHPGIAQQYPALAQAAASAATPQLRNMATLGGTLLQRPRCWYFRNEHFKCWLKGGLQCDAREGENQFHAVFDTGPCRAVHPSDLACALWLLGAEVHVQGSGSERRIPVSEFLAPPRDEHRVETVLDRDELVVSVHLPAPPPDACSIYLKAMDRAVWAFAVVSVAALMRFEEGRVSEARLMLGAVAATPWCASRPAQMLIGTQAGDAIIAEVAGAALAGAQPLRMNAYKIPLAEALVKRALRALRDAGLGG